LGPRHAGQARQQNIIKSLKKPLFPRTPKEVIDIIPKKVIEY
jgi:hypothetical protein